MDHASKNHPKDTQYTDISYACTICKTAYPNSVILREHFKSEHPTLNSYVCPEENCRTWFKSKRYAKQHFVRIHHKKNERKDAQNCEECGKTFKNFVAYNIHKKMKHGVERGFKCRICKLVLQTMEQRKLHYATAHPGELAFQCPECNKGFVSKSGLYGHRKLHVTKTKIDVCPHCQKEFTRRDSYLEHLLIHTGPKHKCPHCPKTFTQKSNLTRHVRIHTGAKPYACQYCPKRFSDKGACNSHTKVHVKEERSDCPVCGKSFSQLQKLKYHLRIHTGEGLVSCEICGKICTNVHSLKEHRARHNTSTQIMCGECGKAFSMDRYLQRHIVAVHGKAVNEEDQKGIPRGVICKKCQMHFGTKKALREHENICINDSDIKIEPVTEDDEEDFEGKKIAITRSKEIELAPKRRRKHTKPVRVTVVVEEEEEPS